MIQDPTKQCRRPRPLTDRETTVLATAKRLASAGFTPSIQLIARDASLSRSTVQFCRAALRARKLWPWGDAPAGGRGQEEAWGPDAFDKKLLRIASALREMNVYPSRRLLAKRLKRSPGIVGRRIAKLRRIDQWPFEIMRTRNQLHPEIRAEALEIIGRPNVSMRGVSRALLRKYGRKIDPISVAYIRDHPESKRPPIMAPISEHEIYRMAEALREERSPSAWG